jgi:hypothetical protein
MSKLVVVVVTFLVIVVVKFAGQAFSIKVWLE